MHSVMHTLFPSLSLSCIHACKNTHTHAHTSSLTSTPSHFNIMVNSTVNSTVNSISTDQWCVHTRLKLEVHLFGASQSTNNNQHNGVMNKTHAALHIHTPYMRSIYTLHTRAPCTTTNQSSSNITCAPHAQMLSPPPGHTPAAPWRCDGDSLAWL